MLEMVESNQEVYTILTVAIYVWNSDDPPCHLNFVWIFGMFNNSEFSVCVKKKFSGLNDDFTRTCEHESFLWPYLIYHIVALVLPARILLS